MCVFAITKWVFTVEFVKLSFADLTLLLDLSLLQPIIMGCFAAKKQDK